jgi:uncharacterized LabA/DUF88 family protein
MSSKFYFNLVKWTTVGASLGGSLVSILLQQTAIAIITLQFSTLGLILTKNYPTEEEKQPSSSVEEVVTPSTPVKGRGRVAIFIDHGNLEHTARDLGIERLEYKALRDVLKGDAPLAMAQFFIGIDQQNPQQKRFINALRNMGYQIVPKNMKRHKDHSCDGNLDVELSLNLVSSSDEYDTAVLVSGDGDFITPVKQVQEKGKKVEVVSINQRTSRQLKQVADRFISLDTIKDQISLAKVA